MDEERKIKIKDLDSFTDEELGSYVNIIRYNNFLEESKIIDQTLFETEFYVETDEEDNDTGAYLI